MAGWDNNGKAGNQVATKYIKMNECEQTTNIYPLHGHLKVPNKHFVELGDPERCHNQMTYIT